MLPALGGLFFPSGQGGFKTFRIYCAAFQRAVHTTFQGCPGYGHVVTYMHDGPGRLTIAAADNLDMKYSCCLGFRQIVNYQPALLAGRPFDLPDARLMVKKIWSSISADRMDGHHYKKQKSDRRQCFHFFAAFRTDQVAATNAAERSSTRSSTCSIPTDKRRRPSIMPMRLLSSADILK